MQTAPQSTGTATTVETPVFNQACYNVLIERLRQNKLGIERGCLERLASLVNEVQHKVSTQRDPIAAAIEAISGFDRFLSRMIDFTLEHSADKLFVVSFDHAKSLCGILFWCRYP